MPADNALHKAANKGDLEEVKKYIESEDEDEKIDVNDPGASERRALHRSAGAGHMDITEYLLGKGAEIDIRDKSGRTALHWAAISGHADQITFLLGNGADVTAVTSSGMNPLHGACEALKVDAAKAIFAYLAGKDDKKETVVMHKNGDEKTPWDVAAASKNRDLCQALKDGGDPNGAGSSCVIC